MCEFDELVDDAVDHDHCYFFHQQLEKRAWKRKKKNLGWEGCNLKWVWLVSLFPYLVALSLPSRFADVCGVAKI